MNVKTEAFDAMCGVIENAALDMEEEAIRAKDRITDNPQFKAGYIGGLAKATRILLEQLQKHKTDFNKKFPE